MNQQMSESIKKDDLKPPKVVKKRKKKSKVYFGTPVQEAIIRYNESSNPAEKNKIYGEVSDSKLWDIRSKLINQPSLNGLIYMHHNLFETKYEVSQEP